MGGGAQGNSYPSSLSLFSGLVLDTVAHGRREAKMLAYLTIPYIGRGFESTGENTRVVAADSTHGKT